MREILMLAHRLPWPPDRGDKIRSWHLLKRLAEIAPVHLACFADETDEASARAALAPFVTLLCLAPRTRSQAMGALIGLAQRKAFSLSLFESAEIRAFVVKTLAEREIGCVFGYSAQMAQFVPADIGDARFAMDFVDVDSAKFDSYAETAGPVMQHVYRREAKKLFAFEAETARRADVSLYVSESEAGLFRRLSGLGTDKVIAVQNGTGLVFFDPDGTYPPPDVHGPLIVFTGQMDYRPNVEAVVRFARETMPLIRKASPQARFAIVGRHPDPAVQALAELPGVIVTGEVPDVRGWLAAANAVVAPLGIARGVQNKVLEAMAMARAVVASPAAFEGIEAVAGRDLLVAEGSRAEAEAVLGLLGDAERAREIGRAARARIEVHYGWAARLAELPAIIGMDAPARASA